MNIGNTYADNKVYRGIKYSNGMPLVAEDLHEFSDTLAGKNKYLLESVLGSGLLKKVHVSADISGISLEDPAVLNITGDICLIQSSTGMKLVNKSELHTTAADTEGTIFVIGWYQSITAASTLKEYGGVRNTTIPNDILYEPLDVQVSTRYQFRWDIAVLEGDISEFPVLQLLRRDERGTSQSVKDTVTATQQIGSIYLAEAPASMTYAVDGLYLIPLIHYTYNSGTDSISSVSSFLERKTENLVLKSDVEPEGVYAEGTTWYNPSRREFKTYIADVGFVDNTTRTSLTHYQYVNIAPNDVLTAQNLTYTIDNPTILSTDIVRVTYEGLELVANVDYVINTTNNQITLLGFTRIQGEKLVVTVTRIVGSMDLLGSHVTVSGNSTEKGHVLLSDDIDSNYDENSGYAATPKAVKEAQILTDTVTGTKYNLRVSNGALSIVEII